MTETIESIITKCECRQESITYFLQKQIVPCEYDTCYYKQKEKCGLIKELSKNNYHIKLNLSTKKFTVTNYNQ